MSETAVWRPWDTTGHVFRLAPDAGDDEPVCAVCGGHGAVYADGWDHARIDDAPGAEAPGASGARD